MVRAEALLMATFGALVGIVLGGRRRGHGPGVVVQDVVGAARAALAGVLALGVLTGLAASALPSRRAARLDVLRAVSAQ